MDANTLETVMTALAEAHIHITELHRAEPDHATRATLFVALVDVEQALRRLEALKDS